MASNAEISMTIRREHRFRVGASLVEHRQCSHTPDDGSDLLSEAQGPAAFEPLAPQPFCQRRTNRFGQGLARQACDLTRETVGLWILVADGHEDAYVRNIGWIYNASK